MRDPIGALKWHLLNAAYPCNNFLPQYWMPSMRPMHHGSPPCYGVSRRWQTQIRPIFHPCWQGSICRPRGGCLPLLRSRCLRCAMCWWARGPIRERRALPASASWTAQSVCCGRMRPAAACPSRSIVRLRCAISLKCCWWRMAAYRSIIRPAMRWP